MSKTLSSTEKQIFQTIEQAASDYIKHGPKTLTAHEKIAKMRAKMILDQTLPHVRPFFQSSTTLDWGMQTWDIFYQGGATKFKFAPSPKTKTHEFPLTGKNLAMVLGFLRAIKARQNKIEKAYQKNTSTLFSKRWASLGFGHDVFEPIMLMSDKSPHVFYHFTTYARTPEEAYLSSLVQFIDPNITADLKVDESMTIDSAYKFGYKFVTNFPLMQGYLWSAMPALWDKMCADPLISKALKIKAPALARGEDFIGRTQKRKTHLPLNWTIMLREGISQRKNDTKSMTRRVIQAELEIAEMLDLLKVEDYKTGQWQDWRVFSANRSMSYHTCAPSGEAALILWGVSNILKGKSSEDWWELEAIPQGQVVDSIMMQAKVLGRDNPYQEKTQD